MQNGMMFGGDGPVMQGTWYNPDTGDAFTVRDSFFEDNQYVVTTTDGRYLKYDQLQRYLQSDMKLEELKKIGREKKQKQDEPLPESVMNILDNGDDSYSDLIIPEDDIFNKPQLGNIYAGPQPESRVYNPNANAIQSSMNMNSMIIEKALKSASSPKVTVSLDWNDYPEKEIIMLKDIMDISADEIVEWYLNSITMMDFIEDFKVAIRNRIAGDSSNAETAQHAECTVQQTEAPPVEQYKPRKRNAK